MNTTKSMSTRDMLAQLAQRYADRLLAHRKRGHRIVVIVTDESGDFIGVGSTTSYEDTREIVRCAHLGEDLKR